MNSELSIMNFTKSSLFVFIFVKYLIYDKYCLRVICYLCIKNLQKNGWECEKAWITFEHLFDIGTYIFNIETYISYRTHLFIYIRLPHICFWADLSQNKIIIKYKITNEKRKDSTSKCFPILLLFDRFCQQSCHFG